MNIEILIPETDNGKRKVTVFNVDGEIIERKYNYGKGFGFLFLTKYPSIENYQNNLSSSGSQLIYSSTNQNDCTEQGRKIEFNLSKL
jgi:hypothetical protein